MAPQQSKSLLSSPTSVLTAAAMTIIANPDGDDDDKDDSPSPHRRGVGAAGGVFAAADDDKDDYQDDDDDDDRTVRTKPASSAPVVDPTTEIPTPPRLGGSVAAAGLGSRRPSSLSLSANTTTAEQQRSFSRRWSMTERSLTLSLSQSDFHSSSSLLDLTKANNSSSFSTSAKKLSGLISREALATADSDLAECGDCYDADITAAHSNKSEESASTLVVDKVLVLAAAAASSQQDADAAGEGKARRRHSNTANYNQKQAKAKQQPAESPQLLERLASKVAALEKELASSKKLCSELKEDFNAAHFSQTQTHQAKQQPAESPQLLERLASKVAALEKGLAASKKLCSDLKEEKSELESNVQKLEWEKDEFAVIVAVAVLCLLTLAI